MSQPTNQNFIKEWSNPPQQLIENFGDEGDFTRKHLLNQALFARMGDVTGKTVLDAGCGQGYLARLLAHKGAIVTGIEPARPWYEYACQREQAEPLGIIYLQEDLSMFSSEPETFDIVVANMVFMDIVDYTAALHNCVQALKPGGALIFSLLHPCFEESGSAWQGKGYVEVSDYFRERVVPQTYGHFMHRPLSTYLNSIIQAGCTLQHISEPQLAEAVAQQHNAERYFYVPGYIVIHATR